MSRPLADGPPPTGSDVGVVVINYNTAAETLACLRSLAALGLGLRRLLVIDNASDDAEWQHLQEGARGLPLTLELTRNQSNLGFAGASEQAIRRLLEDAGVARVLMLNNDAVALPALARWLAEARADMCAARVMKLADPDQIDSLGIVMYRSGLASNRLDPAEPLLGPTGGCAVYSRRLLEALIDAHGHAFDASFFCYAEDTDLAMRALLLGFEPSYHDETVALHGGQASSGGGFNDFVLYHGIRNSIWVLVKDMPVSLLLRWSPWIASMYLAIVLRHGRFGKWQVVWSLYRDAFRLGGPAWRSRRLVRRSQKQASSDLAARISRRFYAGGYVSSAIRDLFPR
jgi:N-acetylglucosaminyl-diphospho-decaprenol L-rhamnosyltransferase